MAISSSKPVCGYFSVTALHNAEYYGSNPNTFYGSGTMDYDGLTSSVPTGNTMFLIQVHTFFLDYYVAVAVEIRLVDVDAVNAVLHIIKAKYKCVLGGGNPYVKIPYARTVVLNNSVSKNYKIQI